MKTWHRRRALGPSAHVATGCIHGTYDHEKAIGREEVAEEYLKGKVAPRLAGFRVEENTAVERTLLLGEFGEIAVLGDAGHWKHQQKSEEIDKVVAGWLNKAGLLLEKRQHQWTQIRTSNSTSDIQHGTGVRVGRLNWSRVPSSWLTTCM